jgi:hypothetical protein
MPRISAFYGIMIYMYHRDHSPSHFHAIYGEHEAVVDIERLAITDGSLPKRARSMVLEWAALHQPELRDNWNLARNHQSLRAIPPLDD